MDAPNAAAFQSGVGHQGSHLVNAPDIVGFAVKRIVHQIRPSRTRLCVVAGSQRNAVEFVPHQIDVAGINIQRGQGFGVGRLAHIVAHFPHVGRFQRQVLQARLDAARPARGRLQILHIPVELLGYERQLPQPPFTRTTYHQRFKHPIGKRQRRRLHGKLVWQITARYVARCGFCRSVCRRALCLRSGDHHLHLIAPAGFEHIAPAIGIYPIH